ncbi:MAG: hypothetical protein ABIP48_08265 [Planctomycetota bacterium]
MLEGPFALVILGGAHDLADNVRKLAGRDGKYVRVTMRWGRRFGPGGAEEGKGFSFRRRVLWLSVQATFPRDFGQCRLSALLSELVLQEFDNPAGTGWAGGLAG